MKKSILFLVVSSLALISCNSGTPSKKQARESFEKIIEETYEGAIKVNTFKKVNGREEDTWTGKSLYIVDCNAEVEFIRDYEFTIKNGFSNSIKKYSKGDKVVLDNKLYSLSEVNDYFAEKTCWIPFEKSENGWVSPY